MNVFAEEEARLNTPEKRIERLCMALAQEQRLRGAAEARVAELECAIKRCAVGPCPVILALGTKWLDEHG